MSGLTKQEKKDIAEIVSTTLKNHNACPHGIDAETADNLKDLGQTWKIGKKTIIITFFSGIVTGLGGLIALGITAKIKQWF